MAISSLRLSFLVSLIIFISSYSPLMIILAIKQIDLMNPYYFTYPVFGIGLFSVALISNICVLWVVKSVNSGLMVEVSKASNKSGEMFSYTIPYVISFAKVDFTEWQTTFSLLLFMIVLFIISYRSQAMLVNPVLAIFGYMLIDCTFKRGDKEIQAMVITKQAISTGDRVCIDKLSHYLYIHSNTLYKDNKEII